jgi:hypothetical protein
MPTPTPTRGDLPFLGVSQTSSPVELARPSWAGGPELRHQALGHLVGQESSDVVGVCNREMRLVVVIEAPSPQSTGDRWVDCRGQWQVSG